MKTVKYYVISSTRCSGIWNEERLESGNGRDFTIAKGFSTFQGAFKFIHNEADKLFKQPGFYRNIAWDRTNTGHEPPEYKLRYEALSATDNKWWPDTLKFRISEKTFVVLDEEEALQTKFF